MGDTKYNIHLRKVGKQMPKCSDKSNEDDRSNDLWNETWEWCSVAKLFFRASSQELVIYKRKVKLKTSFIISNADIEWYLWGKSAVHLKSNLFQWLND